MQNFFDFLGFEPVVQEPEKKEKKATVKTEGTKPSEKCKGNDNKDICSLPVKVVTLFADTVTYGAGSFVTTQPTAKDVYEKFLSEHLEFPKSLCGYYQKNKSTVVVYLKSMYASEKTDVKATSETKYVLGSRTLDLSSLMTDAECEIKAKDIIEAFQKEYPKYGKIKLCYSATENTVIPYFAENSLYASLPLPVNVVFWNHDEFVVTEDDMDALKGQKSETVQNDEDDNDEVTDDSESEEDDETADEGIAETDDKKNARYIGAKDLLKIVESKYPEFKGIVKLLYSKEQNSVIVTLKEASNSSSSTAPKVTMYPTDAEVSLFLHTHFKLQPGWFGGKTEIEEKEFKKFLEERYPEFSPERTQIVYDDKKKLIMPCLKSSSKGVDIATTAEEEEKLKTSPFPFVREYEDGSRYRIESTPFADFKVCICGDGSRNEFNMKLPKLPKTLIYVAREFFREIYSEYDTEAFLQLFYDETDESYFWSLPKQTVTAGSVTAERDILKEREFVLVADFHSHGHYPAFWSGTDNRDEKGTRLFGVMSFHDGDSAKYRIGCGGYFFDVSEDEFVDQEDFNEKIATGVKDFLLKRKERIIVLQ